MKGTLESADAASVSHSFQCVLIDRFVMWYGAGGWMSATSRDGINFTPSKYGRFYSRFGAAAGTDGTGLFIDKE